MKGRLVWDGSQDLQDVSISILNVTYNDSGIYECHVLREFEFDFFIPTVYIVKNITLKVKEEGAAYDFTLSCATFSQNASLRGDWFSWVLLKLHVVSLRSQICVCRFLLLRRRRAPVRLLKIDSHKRSTTRHLTLSESSICHEQLLYGLNIYIHRTKIET